MGTHDTDARLAELAARRAKLEARRHELDEANFARADTHAYRPVELDLVPLFLDAVEALRPPTPAVVIEHPESCLVEADPEMIAIVVHNLVANAIKFAMARAEIRVVLGARPGCSFYVRDNGCGFPPKRAAQALSANRRNRRGIEAPNGIGLATVARVVARHRGRAWAESEPDWGATVFIALPPAV